MNNFNLQARIYCQPIDYPEHICLNRRIYYRTNPPLSGPHRPSWPRYGEYLYVPPQRYIHSLEHGAAVFLYHPCADAKEIEEFKSLARTCLFRHIISPSRLVQPNRPFAILTWGCMLSMGKVDHVITRQYIKGYAIHRAPEAHNFEDGQYSRGLQRPSTIVSDRTDSLLCPSVEEKRQFFNARSQTQQRRELYNQYQSYRYQNNLYPNNYQNQYYQTNLRSRNDLKKA